MLNPIDHFKVVSDQWPLKGSEPAGDLLLIQTLLLFFCKSRCSNAKKMHFHDKSWEVCIKARSLPPSLPFKGQVTEQRNVKWSIPKFSRTYTKHGPGSMDHLMDPVHGPSWTTPWTWSMDQVPWTTPNFQKEIAPVNFI